MLKLRSNVPKLISWQLHRNQLGIMQNFCGLRRFATATPSESNQRTTDFHGSGLAALHRQPEQVAQWRLNLSNRLTKILMSSEKSRLQLLSKRLYIQLDELSPDLLDFFYGQACGIPRNFQSWFSLTQLHVWMYQTRLRNEGKSGQVLHAGLVDHFTTDIEMKLWKAGISNVRVYDRHLHELLSFHYGCVLAYDEGYESGDCILASALWRYVFACVPSVLSLT